MFSKKGIYCRCKVTHFFRIKALSKQFFQFVLIHTRH